MDKAQERHNEAMRKLHERATEFVKARRDQLGIGDDMAAALVGELFNVLTDIYFKGVNDGGDNQRDWHEAIGGCTR